MNYKCTKFTQIHCDTQ